MKVYTVDAAGTVHIRTVATGIQSPQFVQVQSGIQPGETVVLGSHSGLQDGERVQPHFE
jgi:multidrug efflux pump subunit AcrA (membrane-fusion protein)